MLCEGCAEWRLNGVTLEWEYPNCSGLGKALAFFHQARGTSVGAKIEGFAVAHRSKLSFRNRASRSRLAVEKDGLCPVGQLGWSRAFNLVQRNIDGPGNMPCVELGGSADVHEGSATSQTGRGLCSGDLAGSPQEDVGERENSDNCNNNPVHGFSLPLAAQASFPPAPAWNKRWRRPRDR